MPNVVVATNAIALPEQIPPTYVIRGAAEHFRVPVEALVSPDRHAALAYRRHVCIYAAWQMGASAVEIGALIRRDKATVLYAVGRIGQFRAVGREDVERDLIGISIRAREITNAARPPVDGSDVSLGSGIRIRAADALRAASAYFDIPVSMLTSQQHRRVVYARRVAMYVAVKAGRATNVVSRRFGCSCPAVTHAIRTIAATGLAQDIAGVRALAALGAVHHARKFIGVSSHG